MPYMLLGVVGTSLLIASSAVADDAAGGPEESAAASGPTIESLAKEAAANKIEIEQTKLDAAWYEIEDDARSSYTINTLIMFVCAVLVLFMQAGFAMVEIGLNQAKNVVNILFKNVMDLSLGMVLFLVVGFGMMYPATTFGVGDAGEGATYGIFGYTMPQIDTENWTVWFIGSDSFESEIATAKDVFFAGKGKEAAVAEIGTSYSSAADFLFQVAFAATAATIVSGAVAGRMKFGAYLVYTVVLTGFIYPVSGMWKWGGGFLDQLGFQDFAGSIVVHAVGGFAGLAGAMVLGARHGRFSKGKSIPIPGHNLAFAALGVFILWIGWYGFNPGSQLTYNGVGNAAVTTNIALTTSLAAACGAITAMLLAWVMFKKPDVTMALNGVLAGLVGITANCDRVTELGAIGIGAVAGGIVVGGIVLLEKLKIDDPVGAFPVHGLCGVWGGVATGIFGTIPDVFEGSRPAFIGVQCLATVIICIWAFLPMLGLFYVLKLVGFLRVSPEEEQAGLDVTEHGQHAYPPNLINDGYPGSPVGPAPQPVGASKGYIPVGSPSTETA